MELPFPRHLRAVFALLAALVLASAASLAGAQDRAERFIGPGVRLIQWTRGVPAPVPNSPAPTVYPLNGGPNAERPQSIHVVEVDGAQPFIRLGVSLGGGDSLALEPLSRQAERLTGPDRYPIAGVNGDFFYYPNGQNPGIPTNAAVLDGELIRTPFNRSSLVIDREGVPSIRILRALSSVRLPSGIERPLDAVNQPRGANQLVLFTPRYGSTTRTSPAGTEVYLEPEQFPLRHGVAHRAKVLAVQTGAGSAPLNPGRWVLAGSGAAAVFLRTLAPGEFLELRVDFDPALGPEDQVLGGGPRLVRDGRVSVENEGGTLGEAFAKAAHPRTAIGFAGRKVYLVVVDGRQAGSAGISLPDLAALMAELGCTDALNMDGGGSSTLWVRGAVANSPSGGRERPVANGLLVFSSAPKGEPVRLIAAPAEIAALAGAEVPLALTGEDRYYNPVTAAAPRWTIDPALGEVRDGRFIARADAAPPEGEGLLSGVLEAAAGELRTAIPVRVYARPARVELLPAAARLAPERRATFRVRALDSLGRELRLPSRVGWEASPEAGVVDVDGTLTAGAARGRGTVTVTVNGVSAVSQVEVLEAAAGGSGR
jgi:hypothetical protein